MGKKRYTRPERKPTMIAVAEHTCPEGKAPILERKFLEGHAAFLARSLNEQGELAPNFYGYRCPACHLWHITKHSEFHGRANFLVHEAAPEALQRWAMTGEAPSTPLH